MKISILLRVLVKVAAVLWVSFSINATYAAAPFSGKWRFIEYRDASKKPYSTFDLNLSELADGEIRGNYCFVTQNGNRIDCDPKSIEVNIHGRARPNGKFAVVEFYSFFGAKDGVAELRASDSHLIWNTTKTPKGDFFYGPYNVQLKRISEDSHPGERQVMVEKAYLYEQPSTSARSKMYVVKGDYVKLIKISDDFKFWNIQYASSKLGIVESWIDCKAVQFCP